MTNEQIAEKLDKLDSKFSDLSKSITKSYDNLAGAMLTLNSNAKKTVEGINQVSHNQQLVENILLKQMEMVNGQTSILKKIHDNTTSTKIITH